MAKMKIEIFIIYPTTYSACLDEVYFPTVAFFNRSENEFRAQTDEWEGSREKDGEIESELKKCDLNL